MASFWHLFHRRKQADSLPSFSSTLSVVRGMRSSHLWPVPTCQPAIRQKQQRLRAARMQVSIRRFLRWIERKNP